MPVDPAPIPPANDPVIPDEELPTAPGMPELPSGPLRLESLVAVVPEPPNCAALRLGFI